MRNQLINRLPLYYQPIFEVIILLILIGMIYVELSFRKRVNSLWEQLSNKIESQILASIVIIAVVIFTLTSKTWNYILKNTYSRLMKFLSNFKLVNMRKMSQEMRKPISSLVTHRCLRKLERLKNRTHEFKTHGEIDHSKAAAFKVFLESKMDSTIQHINKIISKATYDMDKDTLRSLVETCFDACNKNVKCKMESRFINEGLAKKEAEKLTAKFLELREYAMESYGEVFDEVFQEDNTSNYETLRQVLLLIHVESNGMVDACIGAFEHINGAFMGMDYGEE